ncbi:MAG: DUF2520 domain-containing protein [Bacteroidales bacterium]|nr:DUF2520 domain-containing protein [Bacteroidales bacterium]
MQFVIIGAGNVAHHLAQALKNNNHEIVQVYSRTEQSARQLAEICNASYTNNFKNIIDISGIYVFSLSDDANSELIPKFPYKNKKIIHTSGSINANIFDVITSDYGVLYPLQSLKKDIAIEINQIPFLIEASNSKFLNKIEEIVKSIGANYSEANSEQRLWAHISAVFACNFSNHLLAIANEIAEKNNIPFSLLHPLIDYTFKRSLSNNPKLVQTGPAHRNDHSIMQKHIDLLHEKFNVYENLYKIISSSIFEMYNNDKEEK